MSGNPFRTGNQRLAERLDIPHGGDQAADAGLGTRKDKAKKRVQILSPPQSPVENRQNLARRLSDGLTGSPPPPEHAEDESSSDEELTTEAMNQAMVNTRRNSGSGAGILDPVVVFGIAPNGGGLGVGGGSGGGSGVRAPYNPFARTLATSEASYGRSAQGDDTARDVMDNAQTRSGRGKPVLNVDQFKDILLNGATIPVAPAPVASTALPRNGTVEHVLSVPSRNPMFDTFAPPESPGFAWDHDRPYSDDEGEEGDESTTLMSSTDDTRLDTMAPPAPPKNKSGRTYPQTVSFADFDESIPAGFTKPLTMASGAQHPAGILRPHLTRSSSDLNKPLPRLPPGLQPSNLSSAADAEPPLPSTPLQPEQPADVKPTPPPPLAARRQNQGLANPSQLKSSPGSSEQSLPRAEETTTPSRNTPAKATAAPPPPPPSRRAQQGSPANTPTTTADLSRKTSTSSTDTKLTPLPPPRRAGAKPTSTLSRTSSNASYRSSAPPYDAAAPPPPPPRRDRGSKRSSIDVPMTRRPSDQRSLSSNPAGQDIAETDETPAWEADRQVGVDVLKDLDALQAEIDALRAREERG